jgi:hypothetical protein
MPDRLIEGAVGLPVGAAAEVDRRAVAVVDAGVLGGVTVEAVYKPAIQVRRG